MESSEESLPSSSSSGSTLEPVWEQQARSPPKVAPFKTGLTKVAPPKFGPPKVAPTAVAPTKVASPKLALPKVAPPKVALSEVAPAKATLPKVPPTGSRQPSAGFNLNKVTFICQEERAQPQSQTTGLFSGPPAYCSKPGPVICQLPAVQHRLIASTSTAHPQLLSLPLSASPHGVHQPRGNMPTTSQRPHMLKLCVNTEQNKLKKDRGPCSSLPAKSSTSPAPAASVPGVLPRHTTRPTPQCPQDQNALTRTLQDQQQTVRAPRPSAMSITNMTATPSLTSSEASSPEPLATDRMALRRQLKKSEKMGFIMELIVVNRKRKLREMQIFQLDTKNLPAKIAQLREEHDVLISALDRRDRERDHQTSQKSQTLAEVKEDEGKTDAAARLLVQGSERPSNNRSGAIPRPLPNGWQPSSRPPPISSTDLARSRCSRHTSKSAVSHRTAMPRADESDYDSDPGLLPSSGSDSDCSSSPERSPLSRVLTSVLGPSHEPHTTLVGRNTARATPVRASMANADPLSIETASLESESDDEDSSDNQQLQEFQYQIMTTEKKLELAKQLEKEAKTSYKMEKEQLGLKQTDFQKNKKRMLSDQKKKIKEELKVLEAEIEEGQKRVEKELKLATANLKASLKIQTKNLKEEEKKQKEKQKVLEKQQQKKAKEKKLKQKQIQKEEEKKLAEERKGKKAILMVAHKVEKRKKLKEKILKRRHYKEYRRAKTLARYQKRKENILRWYAKRKAKCIKMANRIRAVSRRIHKFFQPSYGKQVERRLKREQEDVEKDE